MTHPCPFRNADPTPGERTESNRLRGRTHHLQRRYGQLAHHDFALLCPDDVLSPLACSSLAGAYTSLRVHPRSHNELPHHVNISGNTRGTDRPSKDRKGLRLVLLPSANLLSYIFVFAWSGGGYDDASRQRHRGL